MSLPTPLPHALRVKLLSPWAKVPTRGSQGAAGYDLHACLVEDETNYEYLISIPPRERAKVPLGFTASWDPAYYARIAPRSGLALKNGIDVMAGVIDPDYRGEWAAILYNTTDEPFVVNHGDRVAQAVFERFAVWQDVVLVDDLEETARGASGYGSTGV